VPYSQSGSISADGSLITFQALRRRGLGNCYLWDRRKRRATSLGGAYAAMVSGDGRTVVQTGPGDGVLVRDTTRATCRPTASW
jgi:hypothetical protein